MQIIAELCYCNNINKLYRYSKIVNILTAFASETEKSKTEIKKNSNKFINMKNSKKEEKLNGVTLDSINKFY